MPFDIGGVAEQAAGQVLGAGMGLLLEGHNDRRQLRQQEKLQELQIRGNKEMTDYQYRKQLEMWNATNYSNQMIQLEKAGLNPALIYGMSGGGGATTGSASGSVQGANAPTGGGEAMGMMMQSMQLRMTEAQIKLAESQANKNNVEAQKTASVDTDNVKADTANKILDGIIKDFTGREAKDLYERVKSPARGVEAKTYEDELAARQGIAGTIYELWTEGKLKEKSNAEIERILLSNSQTREETKRIVKTMDLLDENIKGAKLDNIITELETKLQSQTGIDRNSPYWLKILGRLFVQLTGN